MAAIQTIEELQKAITLLESKKNEEWSRLKEDLYKTLDDLKPAKLLTKTITEALSSNEAQESLLVSGIGLTAGYTTKALIVGNSQNPLKKLFGTIVQLAITKFITKHPETVNSIKRR
jgi:hypothetical protein